MVLRRPEVDRRDDLAGLIEPGTDTAASRPAFSDLAGRLPTFVALAIAAAWAGLLVLTYSMEPTPDPEQPLTAMDVVVSMSFLYGVLATFAGMGMRRRWGLAASTGAGAVLLGAGALCMLTGHSGAWLAAQVFGGAGMIALSWAALKATAR